MHKFKSTAKLRYKLHTSEKNIDDAVSPFKGKYMKTILKNGSFTRDTLIETVFSLMEVCERLITLENEISGSLNGKDIAMACNGTR